MSGRKTPGRASGLPGLAGKVAIVTGHAQGIGAAISRLLERHEVRVHGFDLPEVDLSRTAEIVGHVHRVAEAEGGLDSVVNNAGVTTLGSLLETDEAEFDRVVAVNLKAPFFLLQAALPYLLRRGGGSIVNIASDQALVGKRDSAIYGATKAALAQLSRSAALDWGPRGIRVNCVAPGSTDTPMLRQVLRELQMRQRACSAAGAGEDYRSVVPLGRFADPMEIAWAVVFLASDAASFINGAVIPVDGGFTAH